MQIRTHDGVLLNAYVARPKGPAKTNLPTVLINTPYLGSCAYASGGCGPPADWSDDLPTPVEDGLDSTFGSYWDEWADRPARLHGLFFTNSLGFPLIHLVKAGYAVALVAVRGTGDSGGCFEWGGRNEQRDTTKVIDWLADQPWSNGKVAMGGYSYMSWTTWQAAVRAPAALKATITGGELTHPWEFSFSPQGSREASSFSFETAFATGFSAHLPGPYSQATFQPTACPAEVVEQGHHWPDYLTDTRDRAFFEERSLRERMKNVRAAVLSAHGFRDIYGHGFQDALMWESLPAGIPKRFVRGWWPHTLPSSYSSSYNATGDTPTLNDEWGSPGWESIVMEWLDAYLRDGPEPERVGVMDFSDGKSWHSTRRGWKVPQEVLHLTSGAARRRPGKASTSFRGPVVSWLNSSYGPEGEFPMYDPGLCDPATFDGVVSATYDTSVLKRPALVAGNAFAYLRLSSDQPRGLVNVEIYDLAPDAHCADPSSSTGTVGVRWLAHGSADLGFYRNRFRARPFPVDKPRWVRIDLLDTAATVPPGHRLRVVLSSGNAFEYRSGRAQDAPLITVSGDSQLILPVFEGTLGGRRPDQHYPPRPFLP